MEGREKPCALLLAALSAGGLPAGHGVPLAWVGVLLASLSFRTAVAVDSWVLGTPQLWVVSPASLSASPSSL